MGNTKFRIWDTTKEEMLLEIDTLFKKPGVSASKILSNKDKNYISMMSIEITDSENDTIFEKDIIKNPSGTKFLVEFLNGIFYLTTKARGRIIKYPINEGYMKNKTIIGNLCETPRLLHFTV